MSAYSNVPFALADDSNFFGSLWETVEGIGNKVIGQASETAEKTGQGVIDNWLNKGSEIVGGALSPGGDYVSLPTQEELTGQLPYSPANPKTNPAVINPCPAGSMWDGTKCITNTGGDSLLKNPLVLGGAGLGIAKLAGLSWGYSIGIGAASYFLAPMLLEKVNI